MRGNDVDDFTSFTLWLYTLDPLLGSQMACQFTDMARGIDTVSDKKGKEDLNEPDLSEMGIFVVDPLTGDRLDGAVARFALRARPI